MNRYFLDPFGCVKNQVDAENMMAHLNNAGWEYSDDAEQADLIIVNSCGFIESAKQESIDAVIGWRKLYPSKKILLAGCLSQRYEKELKETLTESDGFMGVENPAQIVEKAADILNIDFNGLKKAAQKKNALSTGDRPLLSLPGSAYVKISEGCSNCCSYCAIPLIRGSLVSRLIPDILDECRVLLNRGIKELCIIGQDIGAFGKDEKNESKLPELLNAISALEGHFWVRLLYIHPDHFPLQILDLIEKDKRFLPYFDIPFQHASTKILTAMNRTKISPVNKYLELINTIRTRLPDAVIRSTFLLGFPGETDEDFNELLDFQQKAKIDWLGCFVYSREEGTTSYSMKNRVSKKTAQIRKQKIEQCQIPITEKIMDRFVGQSLEVLIEENISEDIWLGRLYCQAPEIDGAAVITGNDTNLQLGDIVPCKVMTRRGFDLVVSVDT
jgi:ribosomal protein S12 methylthiotransferase